jgi:hypothetical protein
MNMGTMMSSVTSKTMDSIITAQQEKRGSDCGP